MRNVSCQCGAGRTLRAGAARGMTRGLGQSTPRGPGESTLTPRSPRAHCAWRGSPQMSNELESWDFAEGGEIAPGRRAVSLLGGGYRYEAWLAWDEHIRALVVAKVVRPDQTEDPVARRTLAREAAMLDRLAAADRPERRARSGRAGLPPRADRHRRLHGPRAMRPGPPLGDRAARGRVGARRDRPRGLHWRAAISASLA